MDETLRTAIAVEPTVKAEDVIKVDRSYFPDDYDWEAGVYDDEGRITVLRCQGMEFVKISSLYISLWRVDNSVGESLNVPAYVEGDGNIYEISQIHIWQPNDSVKSIHLPDIYMTFADMQHFTALERFTVSPENETFAYHDDVLFNIEHYSLPTIVAVPVKYPRERLVLKSDWDWDEEAICGCLDEATTLRDVTFEDPDRYLDYGKFGKVSSPELISSGIFTCSYYPLCEKIDRIERTDDRNLIIPSKFITSEFDEEINYLTLEDDNPVSPDVKHIFIPGLKGDGIFHIYGHLSAIFPSIENVINCGETQADIPTGSMTDAIPLIGSDEEINVIRDTPEYRESLMTPEELEDYKEAGDYFVIDDERYILLSAHAQFIYNASEDSLVLEEITDISAKSIIIPPTIKAMGKEIRLNVASFELPDDSPIETIWLPRGVDVGLSTSPAFRALRFYTPSDDPDTVKDGRVGVED